MTLADIDAQHAAVASPCSSLDPALDLCWLCPHDHGIKTRNRFRLVGPVGKRRFAPPEHADGRDPPEGIVRQDDLFTTAS